MSASGSLHKLAEQERWAEIKQASQFGKVTREQINYRDGFLFTTLHVACLNNAPVDLIRLLLTNGAEVNARNVRESTPLHYACCYNQNIEVVRLLLANGAVVNALGKSQKTPLHYACFKNAPIEVVNLLLENGADNSLKDKFSPPYSYNQGFSAIWIELTLTNDDSKEGKAPLDHREPLGGEASLEVEEVIGDEAPLEAEESIRVGETAEDPAEAPSLTQYHNPPPCASIKSASVASKGSGSVSATSSSALPPFFLDLFAKSSITDSAIQRDYAQKLLKERIDSADVLSTLTKEELKAHDIALGDAIRLLDGAKKMLPPNPALAPSLPRTGTLSLATQRAMNAMPRLKAPLQTYFFASHNWGEGDLNHARVRMVVKGFTDHSQPVWFDNERLKDHIGAQVTRGINETAVFVAFITKAYVEKVDRGAESDRIDWCFSEFDYGLTHRKTKLVTVLMEADMYNTKLWIGPVGFLANKIHIDFTSNDKLDSCVMQLATRITELMSS